MFILEDVGGRKRRPRRCFTSEFKAEIGELCQRGDRSMRQVARDFDLTETAVREWVKQAERDAGARRGLASTEREELAALRRENRRLGEDVEILKQARLNPPWLSSRRRPGERVSVHHVGGQQVVDRTSRSTQQRALIAEGHRSPNARYPNLCMFVRARGGRDNCRSRSRSANTRDVCVIPDWLVARDEIRIRARHR